MSPNAIPAGGDDLGSPWRRHLAVQKDVLTSAMDSVFEAHNGDPIPVVMEALHKELQTLGITNPDGWIRPYAEVISGGRRVSWSVE
jgi:hypothetical protein